MCTCTPASTELATERERAWCTPPFRCPAVPAAPLIVLDHVCLKLTRRSFFALSSSPLATSFFPFPFGHVSHSLLHRQTFVVGFSRAQLSAPQLSNHEPRPLLPIRSSSTNSSCATRPAAKYLNARNARAQLLQLVRCPSSTLTSEGGPSVARTANSSPLCHSQPFSLDRGSGARRPVRIVSTRSKEESTTAHFSLRVARVCRSRLSIG